MPRWARTPLAAFAILAALAIGCSSGGGKTSSTPAPGDGTPATSPEDALARYVQNRLIQGFVADCADAQRPGDVGKQCAIKLGERGDLLAYALGPAFSEPTRILILRPEAGDWTLVTVDTLEPGLPSAPGIPWPLEIGARVAVAGTAPDCLKIREGPGVSSAQLDCIADGTEITVVAGPVEQDSIEWWQLQELGWAAADYLRYPDEAPAATATPD